jgi:hypothetical protein
MIGELAMGVRRCVVCDAADRTAQHPELHQPEPGVRAVQALQDRWPDRVIDTRGGSPSTAIKVRRIFSRPEDHD